MKDTFNYLVGLWVIGHATWVQAYKIKNQDFLKNANLKKNETEAFIEEFKNSSYTATPEHCKNDCFVKGIYYIDFDHMVFPNKTKFTLVKSAADCQDQCLDDKNCVAFTFYKKHSKCFKHDSDTNELTIDDDHDENEIISGPKFCPKYYSFCCKLGYGVSVFITFLILFFSCLAFCCCCHRFCKILCD